MTLYYYVAIYSFTYTYASIMAVVCNGCSQCEGGPVERTAVGRVHTDHGTYTILCSMCSMNCVYCVLLMMAIADYCLCMSMATTIAYQYSLAWCRESY